MGNYISYSRNDLIFSAILISAWLMIRPIFVRMAEQAQAKQRAHLEAEAAAYEAAASQASSGGASTRKKQD
ncbi:hypothetical protein BGZ94_005754 [Podila epigama]|nr:hypothetical protein BGZ94_005754 [Podila epigama]